MTRSAPIAAVFLGLSCSAGTPPPPPEPALPLEGRVVRFGPGQARYRAVSRLHVEQEFHGQAQESSVNLVYYATAHVEREGEDLKATLVLDSIEASDPTTLSTTELADARGATFSGTLSPEGELTGFVGGDSTQSRIVQQLSAGFRQFFPRIPAGGATPGQTWTDTAEVRSDFGGTDLTVRSINDHGATGWIDFSGRLALHIRTETSYTLSGTGSQGPEELTLNGQGERTSHQYISPDGVYLGGFAADTSDISVILSQSGALIPVRQARVDTLQVIQ